MVAITGSALYLLFNGVALDTDYRAFSQTDEGGTVDGSAGPDTDRTYLTTLKDGTASATIVEQAGSTQAWATVAPLASGTLEWGEEGSAAGKQRHYCQAIVTSREKAMEYADLSVIDVEWQFNGTITDGTY
jgi:hypothetical protein